MRRAYPSDITLEQFDVIRPLLEDATKKTHPRKYDLYDVFCTVLYFIREGCTWRAILHDFPKWGNVRYHYQNHISKAERVYLILLEKYWSKIFDTALVVFRRHR